MKKSSLDPTTLGNDWPAFNLSFLGKVLKRKMIKPGIVEAGSLDSLENGSIWFQSWSP